MAIPKKSIMPRFFKAEGRECQTFFVVSVIPLPLKHAIVRQNGSTYRPIPNLQALRLEMLINFLP